MPYLVGVRAKELVNQCGLKHEDDYIQYVQNLDCIEQKCVIEIGLQPALTIFNYFEPDEPDPEDGRFLLLGEGQRTNLYDKLKQLIILFQSTLKKQGNYFEPCFLATDQQQQICEQIMDFLNEQIFTQILQPVEELGKIGNRINVS